MCRPRPIGIVSPIYPGWWDIPNEPYAFALKHVLDLEYSFFWVSKEIDSAMDDDLLQATKSARVIEQPGEKSARGSVI